MNYKGAIGEVAETSGRLWRFADFELDELGRDLRGKGKPIELESKPLDILLQLLLHAGEVVTKEELLESVWPDVMVVDGSFFFFQAEDGIRDHCVTGVQTCALPI